MATPDPLSTLIEDQGLVVLDGGLATELETRGHKLEDALWSARLLLDQREAIGDVHTTYLEAGADCVVSSSYQATLEGFAARGVGPGEARECLQASVDLARHARDSFWRKAPAGRRRPLVAASIGPYGAALADGSEYTGSYDREQEGLYDFHAERFALLADAGADVLACESLPSRVEARALLRLLEETPGAHAWFSFTACDEAHISDGTPLVEVARDLDHERIVAIGVNCTPPPLVPGLLVALRGATDRPLLAYPNSGEAWDVGGRRWNGEPNAPDPGEACAAWRDAGATVIGGCCRVGPAAIRRIRRRLLGSEDTLPGARPITQG